MEKCVIPIKYKMPKDGAGSCVIRVNADQYDEIIRLGNATGRSIADIATRLLEYALDNVEVVDPEKSRPNCCNSPDGKHK